MDAKTKKTLFITAAVIAIALIIWWVFIRPGWQKEIAKLNDLTKDEKKRLKQAVKHVMLDPAYTKEQYQNSATSFGITYDQWIVILAAEELGWMAGTTNGQLDIIPVTGNSSILPNT